jgi:hypothetical protein
MPSLKLLLCSTLLAQLVLGLVAVPVLAQEPATTQVQPPAGTEQPAVDPETADIAITATVRAREVRFETKPQVRVEFFGQPERITEDRTERTNLPEEVQPGVTYRDVVVRLTIASVFAEVDRIVAEILGQVPDVSVKPPLRPGGDEPAAWTAPSPAEEERP